MRSPISKRKRFEVFKRDGFACQYCGAVPPRALLHVDHINPVALGGDNSEDNLITACETCNLGKSAVPLSSVPRSLEDRAAEIAEREAQIAGYAAVMEAALDRVEEESWRVAEALQPGASDGYSRDRINGIRHFVRTIGVYPTLEAAQIASGRYGIGTTRAFKYFCGICWAKIRGERE